MTPPFHIRHAVPADLEAILALDQATEHAPHWPRQTYLEILTARHRDPYLGLTRCLLVAEPDGSGDSVIILGVATASIVRTTRGTAQPPAELESLAVAAAARLQGIGRSLCHAVIEWARTQGAPTLQLEVRATSDSALALYSGLGFHETGRRPRYYSDPDDDALLLTLPL